VPTHDNYLTFLGTGTSVGVPVIGCSCPVCKSDDPRNNRTRSSITVDSGSIRILVDSGPDLREQALREGISSIDAIIYTHGHVDHVAGFDELRAFCWGKEKPLPLFATDSCLAMLKSMFPWAFHTDNIHRGYVKPDPRPLVDGIKIGEISVTPLPVAHGSVETVGLLFAMPNGFRFAYLPDVKTIPQSTMKMLTGLDLLIIDTLRDGPHSTHLSLPEALAISEKLSPTKTLLTHMSHDLDHASLAASLPSGVSPAYDGLRVPLEFS
jgi:phosphoribosyl 1,2-cyclic phosphate phosphodiesterase